MKYRVLWSDAAIEDVRGIFDEVAEFASRVSATKLARDLLASTRSLPDFPRMFQVFPCSIDDARHIVVRSQWRVLYVVDDAAHTCTVLTVVHASRIRFSG